MTLAPVEPTGDNSDDLFSALYRERAHLVAHLAAIYPSMMVPATDEDWAIVYIDLPANQVSWHIAPADLDLFTHVDSYAPLPGQAIWDGHTTEEKYNRLEFATAAEADLKGRPSWKQGIR